MKKFLILLYNRTYPIVHNIVITKTCMNLLNNLFRLQQSNVLIRVRQPLQRIAFANACTHVHTYIHTYVCACIHAILYVRYSKQNAKNVSRLTINKEHIVTLYQTLVVDLFPAIRIVNSYSGMFRLLQCAKVEFEVANKLLLGSYLFYELTIVIPCEFESTSQTGYAKINK